MPINGANNPSSPSGQILRYKVTGASINAVADAATFSGLPAKWRLRKLTVYETSTTLATSIATVGAYTGAGATGNALAALGLITGLTAAAKTADLTLAALAGTDYQTSANLYIRCGVAHGSAATISVAIEIEDLS